MVKLRKNRAVLDFKITENNCFEIINRKPYSTGYCQIKNNGIRILAHRHIYEECFGFIPKGLVVRHKCDNKLCINPEHLELGTLADNIQDKVKRNRCAKGEKIPTAKLTKEQVKEICVLRGRGMTLVKLSEKFKVSPAQISSIVRGLSWKQVNGEREAYGW